MTEEAPEQGADPYNDPDKASLITEEERQAYTAARDRIRAEYLFSREHRPPTTGRGVHHVALICRDVETTVEWYQNVAGFPVTVLFENRDLAGSTHFFFDVGAGNCLRSSTCRAWTPGPTPRCSAGCTTSRSRCPSRSGTRSGRGWTSARSPYVVHSEVSIYTTDPDGARIEFLHDPLGEMYGEPTT